MEALQKLVDIFKANAARSASDGNDGHQTSSTPTTLVAIRITPRTHGQQTRNDPPGVLPISSEGAEAPTTRGWTTADRNRTAEDNQGKRILQRVVQHKSHEKRGK